VVRSLGVSRRWQLLITVAATALLLLGQPLTRAATASSSARATLVAGFTDSVVISGLQKPTVVQFASDGSIVVAEKGGQIWSYSSLSDTHPTLVADLSTSVDDYWDRGLLGMALPPNYPADNHIYVLYARDAPLGGTPPVWNDVCPTPPGPNTDGCVVSGRLSRLTISGGVSVGEQVLLDGWCQQFPSHSIGTVMFGNDGYLYVSGGEGADFNAVDYGQFGGQLSGDAANPCGDPPGDVGTALTPPNAEGGSLRSQSVRRSDGPTLLSGAVLRLDPATGDAAPGNPFVSDDLNAQRIIAYGLRNPFRMTTRPGTNEIWIGDVGWKTWEEINRIPDTTSGPAHNFGWPCYEGNGIQPAYQSAGLNLCTSLYQSPGSVSGPYFTYKHPNKLSANDPCPKGGSSTSGLAFYPGGSYPATYQNALFFADHTRDCMWVMLPDASGNPNPKNIVTLEHAANPVYVTAGPASLGNDIFYVDLDGGKIHRLSYASSNQPPVAVANITPSNGPAPLDVQYSGVGSQAADGSAVTYQWNFGDGGSSTAQTGTHTYAQDGSYQATLTVTDSKGLTDSATVPVLVGANITSMTAKVTSPTGVARAKYRVGDKINFSGTAVDDGGASIPASDFSWHLSIHHCYTPTNCHTHDGGTIAGVQSGTFTAPDHEFPCYLTVELTVSVPGTGQTITQSRRVDPTTVQLHFATLPTGVKLKLSADEFTGPAPFSKTFVVGHLLTVSAPTQQTVAGHHYTWRKWSDGQPASHTILVTAAKTVTATYRRP
jgi:glucose/arabinose dehydrogenase